MVLSLYNYVKIFDFIARYNLYIVVFSVFIVKISNCSTREEETGYCCLSAVLQPIRNKNLSANNRALFTQLFTGRRY